MRESGLQAQRVCVGGSKLGTPSGASLRKGTKCPDSLGLELVSVSEFQASHREVGRVAGSF